VQKRRVFLFLSSVSLVCAMALFFAGACGGTQSIPDGGGKDGAKPDVDAGVSLYPQYPDASCKVKIDQPPQGAQIHVDEFDSSLVFLSNPPAGGPHYPIWARWTTMFGQYAQTPIPRGYYLHNAEHGGVMLLYKCSADAGMPDGGFQPDGGSCAERAESFLWQAANAIPTDMGCMPPIRVATIITPDPDIPTPIAAVTWSWTYTAECQDLPTLVDFVKRYYGRGPESPATGQAACGDGFYP
jgi:hypothetical protein